MQYSYTTHSHTLAYTHVWNELIKSQQNIPSKLDVDEICKMKQNDQDIVIACHNFEPNEIRKFESVCQLNVLFEKSK